MKIALLTGTFSRFSGIDRVVQSQYKELVQQGNEVHIFCLESDFSKSEFRLTELGMPGCSFCQRVYRLIFFIFKKRINSYAEKLKSFHVIYSHQYPMNLIALQAKKKYNLKYIYYNHGLPELSVFSNIGEKIYISLFKKFAKKTIVAADEIISISKFLQSELKKETGRDSRVEYNKIDEKKLKPSGEQKKIVDRYNLGDDKIILFVGRLSPHKGVHLLIESFNILKKKIPQAKLLLVGKPTFKGYYKRLKKISDDSVIFTGFVPDEELADYFAVADVYATCSLWEGFNLPIAEAQSLGVPVVAFNLGPHPEIIDERGILVEPENIDKFAEAMVNKLKEKDEEK